MRGLELHSLNQIVGENIRKYRLLKGFKQEELAKGLCSISQLSKFETGKTQLKPDIVKQLADRLGVTIELLETSDALLVELRERMRVCYQAAAAGQVELSLSIARQVIEKTEDTEYIDIWAEGLMMECRLLNDMQQPKLTIEKVERALAKRSLLPEAKIILLIELARAYEKIGKRKSAYDLYYQADEEYNKVEWEGEGSLRLNFRMGYCHYRLRNNQTGWQFADLTVKQASEMSKHAWRIRGLDVLGLFLCRLGKHEQAMETFLHALLEAQENNMLLETGALNNGLGALLLEMGDLAQARVYLQRAHHVLEMIDFVEELLECKLHLAHLALQEGDAAACQKQIEQTHALLKSFGDHTYMHHARAHRLYGALQKTQGDFAGYVAQMQMALLVYDRSEEVFEAFEVAVDLADALYEQKDPCAVEYYRKAIGYKRMAEKYSKR